MIPRGTLLALCALTAGDAPPAEPIDIGSRLDRSATRAWLCTNTAAILPLRRAPHLFIGLATRFVPDRGQQVEPIFITSRDGLRFRPWG